MSSKVIGFLRAWESPQAIIPYSRGKEKQQCHKNLNLKTAAVLKGTGGQTIF
jgi:hypothetical protein